MSEYFFSGYCRQLDAPRMVELEAQEHQITDVDCCYGNCPFQAGCTIAKEIDDLLE